MNSKILIVLALLISPAMFVQKTFAQDRFKPKTVFLIRHAEKEDVWFGIKWPFPQHGCALGIVDFNS